MTPIRKKLLTNSLMIGLTAGSCAYDFLFSIYLTVGYPTLDPYARAAGVIFFMIISAILYRQTVQLIQLRKVIRWRENLNDALDRINEKAKDADDELKSQTHEKKQADND